MDCGIRPSLCHGLRIRLKKSRPARTSTLPILISSPLFGLGLNFVREPDILWTRFDHVDADTNQIIQTVNRANRRDRPCSVRIYGNVRADAEFKVPGSDNLREEVRVRLLEEATLTGYLEEHLQLDRTTYKLLRPVEQDSSTALSILVRDNAIQNFEVVQCEVAPMIDKEQAEIVKVARVEAKCAYNDAIVEASTEYGRTGTLGTMVKLDAFTEEHRSNWRSDDARLEREFETELAAIFMSGFALDDPVAVKKINLYKVRRLFGEMSPWLSAQYARDRFPEWAKVEAEKTNKLIVLVEKLRELARGEIDVHGLSAALTRDGQLGDAFKALAGSDREYQTVGQKIGALKAKRDAQRQRGGVNARAKVTQAGLALLRELLEPLGITYGKQISRGVR